MRRQGYIPEFLLFRGVRLVGGVWVSNSRRHKWPHPILRWTLPKSSVHLPLSESFNAESGAFTTILRHNPQKDWELPSDHKRSQQATKGLNSHKRRIGSKVPRVTSSQTFTSTNHRGESKPMHKSNGKSTRSAQVLHSQIPPKATNAYGGRR